MKEAKCLLCELPGAKVTNYIESNVGFRIVCSICGEYTITDDALYKLQNEYKDKLSRLSTLAQGMRKNRQQPLEITGDNIKDLLSRSATRRKG